ncbi:MAG: hypothetical protein VXY99_00205, partial [Pseudomonadota bacterium]|nr:hypothetical protein [Pseudomonadota bacterium]
MGNIEAQQPDSEDVDMGDPEYDLPSPGTPVSPTEDDSGSECPWFDDAGEKLFPDTIFMFSNGSFHPNDIIIDSGATLSITGDYTAIHNLNIADKRPYIGANGIGYTGGSGYMRVITKSENGFKNYNINAQFCQGFKFSLLSVSQLSASGCHVSLGPRGGTLTTPDKHMHDLLLIGKLYIWRPYGIHRQSTSVLPADKTQDVNPLLVDPVPRLAFAADLTDINIEQEYIEHLPSSAPKTLLQVHHQLGCANVEACKQYAKAEGIALSDQALQFCNACSAKKTASKGLKMSKDDLDSTLFATAQVDFLGPFEESYNGRRYLLVISEYVSGWVTIVITANTSNAWRHIVSCHSEHPNIRRVYCDDECYSTHCQAACNRRNIDLRRITTGSHHRIGQVERCNRTLLAMIRT